jgi:putative addiction module killer protein
MSKFGRSRRFEKWLAALADDKAQGKIEARILRAESGDFGDCGSVGEGVFEMRIHWGPGYRLYYFLRGRNLYWLLAGGDKSTQATDIEIAKAMKRRIERGKPC